MNSVLATRAPTLEPSSTVSWRRTEIAPLSVVIALTLGTFLLHLTQMHQSLFGDEVWTFQQVTGRSLGSMLHAIRPPAENAPPLFFILAWEAARHGDPTVWIRLPSLILGAATVPAIYFLGRETIGRSAGLIGAAAFAVSPFATYYGIEARPYATMAFFVVLSSVALLRAVRTGATGWWVSYALAAAAAAYSGYTAVFPLAVQAGWALWTCRDRVRRPLLANAAVVLLYVPWIPHVGSKALGIIGALEPFGVHNVLNDLLRLIAGYPYASVNAIPTIPGLVVLCVCALAGAVARGRSRPRPHLRLIVALALAAPVGVALYSLLSTDIWDARDLYSSLPAAMLVLGALLAAVPFSARVLAVVAVLSTLTFGTIRALSPSYARPPYRSAATYLNRVAGPRDPIIVFPSFLFLNNDIEPELHGPHLIINGIPRRWPSPPRGGAAYVIVDDTLDRALRIPFPRPPGFELIAHRSYRGLARFTLLTFRAAGG